MDLLKEIFGAINVEELEGAFFRAFIYVIIFKIVCKIIKKIKKD